MPTSLWSGYTPQDAWATQVLTALQLVHNTFWWPSLADNAKQYVNTCTVCAQSRTSSFQPVCMNPCPCQHPWSHITVYFLINLQISQGHTIILVAEDQFSEVYKLVPLKGLLTAIEMAQSGFSGVCISKPWPTWRHCIWSSVVGVLQMIGH